MKLTQVENLCRKIIGPAGWKKWRVSVDEEVGQIHVTFYAPRKQKNSAYTLGLHETDSEQTIRDFVKQSWQDLQTGRWE